jgi:Spy/CpxP family protein refolding chaperone
MVEPVSPRPGRGSLAVLGIFALGIVFGLALSFVIVHHGGRFSPLHGRHDGDVLVLRLARRLDLDAAQQEKIRGILDRGHAKMHGILDDTRAEVRAELRPDQQSKFDKMQLPGSVR